MPTKGHQVQKWNSFGELAQTVILSNVSTEETFCIFSFTCSTLHEFEWLQTECSTQYPCRTECWTEEAQPSHPEPPHLLQAAFGGRSWKADGIEPYLALHTGEGNPSPPPNFLTLINIWQFPNKSFRHYPFQFLFCSLLFISLSKGK